MHGGSEAPRDLPAVGFGTHVVRHLPYTCTASHGPPAVAVLMYSIHPANVWKHFGDLYLQHLISTAR